MYLKHLCPELLIHTFPPIIACLKFSLAHCVMTRSCGQESIYQSDPFQWIGKDLQGFSRRTGMRDQRRRQERAEEQDGDSDFIPFIDDSQWNYRAALIQSIGH